MRPSSSRLAINKRSREEDRAGRRPASGRPTSARNDGNNIPDFPRNAAALRPASPESSGAASPDLFYPLLLLALDEGFRYLSPVFGWQSGLDPKSAWHHLTATAGTAMYLAPKHMICTGRERNPSGRSAHIQTGQNGHAIGPCPEPRLVPRI